MTIEEKDHFASLVERIEQCNHIQETSSELL
jgi:signal transduction histidine kinase